MTATQTELKAEPVFPDLSHLSDADLFALDALSEKRERGHAFTEDETALFNRLDARIEFVSRDELARREAVFRPSNARPDTQQEKIS